jgi:predicted acyl esterase
VPLFDAPGTVAQYTSAPLAADTDVVGPPRVTLRLGALSAAPPTLFLKVEDVAPDGSVTLPGRLVAPIRPSSLAGPVTVTLPAIARFPVGHRVRLVVAGSDGAYRGAPGPAAVSVTTDPAAPGTLTLPVVRR